MFTFVDDPNSIKDGGEFATNYCNIYSDKLEYTDKREASFFDLDIKNQRRKVGIFDKRDLFPFPITRMPDKSSNVQYNLVYSANGAVSSKTSRVNKHPDSFSTANKPLHIRIG